MTLCHILSVRRDWYILPWIHRIREVIYTSGILSQKNGWKKSLIQWATILFHHHHYHGVPTARISLILFHNPYLSDITIGKFSQRHPVSAQSWSMLVSQHRCVFAQKSLDKHCLWVRSYFSSSAQLIWIVARWEVRSHKAAIL